MENVSEFLVGRTDQYGDASEGPMGIVSVPSGRLRIVDAFGNAEGGGCVLLVPPGEHRAWVTLVSLDQTSWQPAYLSVAFSAEPPATVAFADYLVAPPIPSSGAVTGTDTATIAVYDDAAGIDLAALQARLAVELDAPAPMPTGYANVTLGSTRIAACHTGRDGAFPILATATSAGHLTAVHIDFYLVDFDPGDD